VSIWNWLPTQHQSQSSGRMHVWPLAWWHRRARLPPRVDLTRGIWHGGNPRVVAINTCYLWSGAGLTCGLWHDGGLRVIVAWRYQHGSPVLGAVGLSTCGLCHVSICADAVYPTQGTMVPMRSDEILSYGYIKPRDLWFPTEETSQPISLGSLGGSGLCPSGNLAHTLRLRNSPEAEKPRPLL
jgi:hypothetical protein